MYSTQELDELIVDLHVLEAEHGLRLKQLHLDYLNVAWTTNEGGHLYVGLFNSDFELMPIVKSIIFY